MTPSLRSPALFRLHQRILGAKDTRFSNSCVVDGRANEVVPGHHGARDARQ